MELLQVFEALMMVVILQFSLCLHELQRLVISVDECVLPENVMRHCLWKCHVCDVLLAQHLFLFKVIITQ